MKKVLEVVEKNFMIFIIYSFLGWAFEELWYLLFAHKIVNRGLLFGPYLPVYGFGLVIVYNLLWKFRHRKHRIFHIDITPLLVFIFIFFIATGVEYLSHYLLDAFFNIELWDYSKKFLNINGRVCFTTSLCFAIGGIIALYFVQPRIERWNQRIVGFSRHILNLIMVMVLLVDLICTMLFK